MLMARKLLASVLLAGTALVTPAIAHAACSSWDMRPVSGTSYQVQASDNCRVLWFDATSGITITLPDPKQGFSSTFETRLVATPSGSFTINSGSSATINGQTSVSVAQSATLLTLYKNWYGLLDTGGGGGSGTVTQNGNLTAHAPLIGGINGTTDAKAVAPLTDGQLLVGATGADPTPRTISGDATLSAGGALTIGNNAITAAKINSAAVTYAKIQNGASTGLLGVNNGAAPTEVAIGSGLSLSGGTLSAIGGGAVSVTAATPNIVITPSPGTGTFTVGGTNPQNTPADGGSHSYTVLSGDATKEVILASTFTVLAVPQATGSFAAGYSFTGVNKGAVTATSTTSTINGIAGATGIKLGANQFSSWDSDGANWLVGLGLPQPATQTGSDYLADDMTWKAAPVNMTNVAGGLVPTPPNDATKFLNGAGAFTTPAGGGGGALTLIQTQTASASASLDFTSLGTYDYIEFKCTALIPASNAQIIQVRVHSGGSFQATNYDWSITFSTEVGTNGSSGAAAATGIAPGASQPNSAPGTELNVRLNNITGTAGPKTMKIDATSYDGTHYYSINGMGVWTGGNGAVDGLQFFYPTGNITSGKCSAFGYSS